jgi:hypothetical protein
MPQEPGVSATKGALSAPIFNLSHTLGSGQVFRWGRDIDGWWKGTAYGTAFHQKRKEDTVVFWASSDRMTIYLPRSKKDLRFLARSKIKGQVEGGEFHVWVDTGDRGGKAGVYTSAEGIKISRWGRDVRKDIRVSFALSVFEGHLLGYLSLACSPSAEDDHPPGQEGGGKKLHIDGPASKYFWATKMIGQKKVRAIFVQVDEGAIKQSLKARRSGADKCPMRVSMTFPDYGEGDGAKQPDIFKFDFSEMDRETWGYHSGGPQVSGGNYQVFQPDLVPETGLGGMEEEAPPQEAPPPGKDGTPLENG